MTTAGALALVALLGAAPKPSKAPAPKPAPPTVPATAPVTARPPAPAVQDVPVKDPLPEGLQGAPDASLRARTDRPVQLTKLPEDRTSVRGRLRFMAHELAEPLKTLPGEGRLQTLAVLTFGESGPESKKRELGRLVSAELATVLRRDHGLSLVERERIDAVVKEGYLNELGLVDEKSAVKLGELLSAQALVVGTVSDAGNEFLVNARIVPTDTGAVFNAAQGHLPADGLVSYASEAVVLRTKSGAVFRSLLIPGWGQLYNRQDAKGWVFLGVTGALLLTTITLHVVGVGTHSRYLSEADVGRQGQLLKQEESFYFARNAAVYVTAGMWAYNVIDAFVNGKTYDPARAGD